ncbi:ubiquitin carboxyl-terminal hydrolase [Anaeramoeba flamelloides]|uniref:Ubiquitin carboxyl-terminal hydrolase n=1 Tax=Anaeramoeba flamelloides TaxID=1746091 RepID=A0AAV8AE71_9EUKA|nr:ubiquitin carboxyl-terminal hydrolase [Anaeramoeba flamelloides]
MTNIDHQIIYGMGFPKSEVEMVLKRLGNSATTDDVVEELLKNQNVDQPMGNSPYDVPNRDSVNSQGQNNTNEFTPQKGYVGTEEDAVHSLVNLSKSGSTAQAMNDTEQAMIQQVIEASILSSQNKTQDLDSWYKMSWPTNPYERMRIEGIPTGLLNVGNTCYVNSMIQSYFMLPHFRKKILQFRPTQQEIKELTTNQNNEKNVVLPELEIIHEFQRLFSAMISSNLRFVNPKKPIKLIFNKGVDEFFKFGQQNDVTEFHDKFCDKIEKAIFSLSNLAQEEKQEPEQTKKEHEQENKQEQQKESMQKQEKKQTWMSDLFYGESVISVTGLDEKKKEFEFINKEDLGRIILDIECGDLYSSLDSYTMEEGIEYTLPSKCKTTVSKELSFEKLPKILIFQLQRVMFDKESLRSRKNNQPFKFEKELFFDRYMFKNLERTRNTRKNLKLLKIKKQQLIDELEQLNDYENSNMSLDLSLNHLVKYFETMSKDLDPNIIENNQLDTITQFIQEHQTKIENRIKFLKNEINEIEIQLKNIFVTEKEVGYTIFSVLIHRGIAGSGHYFSFIYDPKNEQWWKFNDREVLRVSEEEAMKDSIGEKNRSTNAYCLIYVTSDFEKSDLLESIIKHRKYIPEEIQKEIKDQNQQFQNEIEKWDEQGKKQQIRKDMNDIQKIMNEKYDSISKYVDVERKYANMRALKSLIHYSCYIKNENATKKFLLDEIIYERFLKEYEKKVGAETEKGDLINELIHDNENINDKGGKEMKIGMESEKGKEMETEKKMEIEIENEIKTPNQGQIKKEKMPFSPMQMQYDEQKMKEIKDYSEKMGNELLKNISKDDLKMQVDQIRFDFAEYQTFYKMLLSALKNILIKDYLEAMNQIYYIYEKIHKSNQINTFKMDLVLLSKLCQKEIVLDSLQFFNLISISNNKNDQINNNNDKDGQSIDLISIGARHINNIKSSSIITSLMDKKKESVDQSLMDILFPSSPNNILKDFYQLENQLYEINKKLEHLQYGKLVTLIKNLNELLRNPIKFLSFEPDLPNLNKLQPIESNLFNELEEYFIKIQNEFQDYFNNKH